MRRSQSYASLFSKDEAERLAGEWCRKDPGCGADAVEYVSEDTPNMWAVHFANGDTLHDPERKC